MTGKPKVDISKKTTSEPGLVSAHTGMRGLLAFWIVIFHSLFFSIGWNLHGSALMPIFFLMSGYSLAIGYGNVEYNNPNLDNHKSHPQQDVSFDFKRFYRNRFARIAPIYYVTMLIGIPLAIFGHGWVPPSEFGWVFITNLFAVQMWASLPPLSFTGPAWTISTLVFFYLVFPWLLKWHQGQTDQSLNRWISILAVLQAIVYFALSTAISTIDDFWAFWVSHAWPISRLAVFDMGLVAGLLALRQRSPQHDTSIKLLNMPSHQWGNHIDRRAGLFSLFIILFSLIQILSIDLLAAWWMQAVFPFMLLQIIVALSMVEQNAICFTLRLLNWPPFLFLGKISLSLYLIHEPIIQYVTWIARPDQPWKFGMVMPTWGVAIVIPLSIVLAILLERYIETPLRHYLKSKPNHKSH